MSSEAQPAGVPWSPEENVLIVEDYFSMLVVELEGSPYVKRRHNEELRKLLRNRNSSSVERKHMNISAILEQLGLPFLEGYKPYRNFQQSLVPVVQVFLAAHPEFFALVEGVQSRLPAREAGPNAHELREVRPPKGRLDVQYSSDGKPPVIRTLVTDYLEIERRNRELGQLGEEYVLEYERLRLRLAGRDVLAREVVHVSKVEGDHVGYDVRSFDPKTSEPVSIEVKTTNFNARRPFIISQHEVEVSRAEGARYRLYRVFKFSQDPQFFSLLGPVENSVRLEPLNYRGSI
ncbi:MAG: DUF3883 domain-containing protein [Candidatus Eisenbacteria bacterium]|uniref:DUF3883 domain-containing protein n=1 Tax=Eiseniibacteriota bacterium TaxID=2212470 RepID=A0A849SM90_UNCEI|nr:DUF3883 domain-containing protein [Candidatus Eisenbacteria bacterium]